MANTSLCLGPPAEPVDASCAGTPARPHAAYNGGPLHQDSACESGGPHEMPRLGVRGHRDVHVNVNTRVSVDSSHSVGAGLQSPRLPDAENTAARSLVVTRRPQSRPLRRIKDCVCVALRAAMRASSCPRLRQTRLYNTPPPLLRVHGHCCIFCCAAES